MHRIHQFHLSLFSSLFFISSTSLSHLFRLSHLSQSPSLISAHLPLSSLPNSLLISPHLPLSSLPISLSHLSPTPSSSLPISLSHLSQSPSLISPNLPLSSLPISLSHLFPSLLKYSKPTYETGVLLARNCEASVLETEE